MALTPMNISKPAPKRSKPPAKSVAAVSRQAILDTAARLFRQQGYAAASLRAIADACDMKAGSLYYHFESKDQIVSEVLDIGVQRAFDAVRLDRKSKRLNSSHANIS